VSESEAFDVAVVGGGVSGLVAAYRLQQRGHRVAIVDANREAGGVIASHDVDGYLYETGANSTLDTTPLLNALFDDLAIRAERVEAADVAKNRYVVRAGRLQALPMSPPALLRTRAFTLRAKLRLLREPFIPRSAPDSEETIAAFVRRRLGNEFLDYAIDPFVSGVYAGDPERISVRAAFPRLFALEQAHGSLIRGQIAGARARRRNPETAKNTAKSFSFRGGMQTLPRALAGRLSHYLPGVEARAVAAVAEGKLRVVAPGFAVDARALVLAAPSHAAARLVEACLPEAARSLSAIEYAPVAVVASAYRREDVEHDLAGFGFLVPRVERRTVLGSLFSSSLFEGRAPAGHALFTTFVGGQREPAAVALDDAALANRAANELASLVGARVPLWSRIVRWPQAIPQYTIGHLDRIAAIDAASASMPGLFYCANWRGGVAVGDCVKSAHEVAERVHAYLSPAG
jgi:oxygen-dependent protoporphyrinogen oxidase